MFEIKLENLDKQVTYSELFNLLYEQKQKLKAYEVELGIPAIEALLKRADQTKPECTLAYKVQQFAISRKRVTYREVSQSVIAKKTRSLGYSSGKRDFEKVFRDLSDLGFGHFDGRYYTPNKYKAVWKESDLEGFSKESLIRL